MIHVAPLLRSRFRLPAWRRAPGPHGFVCLPKPGEADKSILIMNVHPSAVVNPPGPTTREPFAPAALYELKIDTNGDAVADIAYRVRFSSSEGGSQTATLRRVEGAQAGGTGDGGQVIIEAAPVSTGRDARRDGGRRVSLLRGLAQRSLLLRHARGVERSAVHRRRFLHRQGRVQHRAGNAQLCPWTQTGRPVGAHAGRRGRVWVQADRGALPAQAVFLVGSEREAYLAGEPANDARFIAVFAHALEHAGGYAPEEARRAAGTLLPDVLSYDPTRPASFPSNGRTLTDDAATPSWQSSQTGR